MSYHSGRNQSTKLNFDKWVETSMMNSNARGKKSIEKKNLYRYMFGKLSRFASFATFDTNSSYITSPFLISLKIIMEIIQNNFKILVLVVWNLIPQNPR